MDPEFSILKQRLARRMRYEGMTDEDIQAMDLVQITKARTPSYPLGVLDTFRRLVLPLVWFFGHSLPCSQCWAECGSVG